MPEGTIISLTNKNVIDFIKHESANIKFVRECFDFVYSGIKLNENGSRVYLTTNEGETLAINLENYVASELMNYKKDIF